MTDLPGAVWGVYKSLGVDGVIRGLHEVAKHIGAGKAQVVILAESCNEPTYKKLVQGLCLEKNVPFIDMPDNKALGEWAGLCKIDKDGMPRKADFFNRNFCPDSARSTPTLTRTRHGCAVGRLGLKSNR